ncbi:MAG: methyltransferase domain-containing protein [Patescibacteria group bacterium]|nr:methyltransferase domain-containing protein [Patescibacteria group bacterium]
MIFPFNHIKQSPHRNQLEKHLEKTLPQLSGSVLDVGSKSRRYDYLLKTRPEAIDLAPDEAKNIKFGDVCDLQYPDNFFDNVLCLEVFEYLRTPQKAASEIYRVLKPGGKAVLSAPFMYKAHGDQLRYTAGFWEKELLKDFPKKEIRAIGNFYTIILDILRGNIAKLKFRPLRYILYLPYLFLVFFVPLSWLSRDQNYISGYFITAEK